MQACERIVKRHAGTMEHAGGSRAQFESEEAARACAAELTAAQYQVRHVVAPAKVAKKWVVVFR